MGTYMYRDSRETLCWYCKNAVASKSTGDGCSWSRKFEPVYGWNADMVVVKCYNEADTPSFLVKECPEFIKG